MAAKIPLTVEPKPVSDNIAHWVAALAACVPYLRGISLGLPFLPMRRTNNPTRAQLFKCAVGRAKDLEAILEERGERALYD